MAQRRRTRTRAIRMMSKRKPRRTNAPVARHAFVYVSHIYYSQVKSSQELVPILIVVKSSQVKSQSPNTQSRASAPPCAAASMPAPLSPATAQSSAHAPKPASTTTPPPRHHTPPTPAPRRPVPLSTLRRCSLARPVVTCNRANAPPCAAAAFPIPSSTCNRAKRVARSDNQAENAHANRLEMVQESQRVASGQAGRS